MVGSGYKIFDPMNGQFVNENNSDMKNHKSSFETVEDIEKILLNLLNARESSKIGLQTFLDNPELIQSDVSWLKYVVDAYENIKKIDMQLVNTQAKWVTHKKMAGEDANGNAKFAPHVFKVNDGRF